LVSPGKTGQIASNAVEHPGLKKLIEAGEVEIVGEGSGATGGAGESYHGRPSTQGFTSGRGGRRSGDR
jgi:hypothetical protein